MRQSKLCFLAFFTVTLLSACNQPNATAQPQNTADTAPATEVTAPAPGALVREEAITNNTFNSVAGELKVVSEDPQNPVGLKLITLGNQPITGFGENDFITLHAAYRYAGKDVVLVTDNCSGSACTDTSVSLIELSLSGEVIGAKVLGRDEDGMHTSIGDGQPPKVEIQDDGTLFIHFENDFWMYVDGEVVRPS